MKTRLNSLVIFLVVLLAMLSTAAYAATGDVDINLGPLFEMDFVVDNVVAGFDDEYVEVSIVADRNPGIYGMRYELSYDKTAFTLVSQPVLRDIDGFEIMGSALTTNPHVAIITALEGSQGVIGNGKLVTYKFKINSGAEAGKYDVIMRTEGVSANGLPLEVFSSVVNNNGDFMKLPNKVVNGSIVIPGYTVTFNTVGGTGGIADLLKTKGKDITLPSDIPVRKGYDFLGWSETLGAAQADYSAGGVFSKDADTTLYAVWKKQPIAQDAVELSVSTVDAVMGGEAVVTVSVGQNPGFTSIGFKLDYDKNALEYVSSESASTVFMFVPPVSADANFGILKADVSNPVYTGSTALINITFKVKENAPEGLAHVSITPIEDDCFVTLSGVDEKLTVAVTDGGVNVAPAYVIGDIDMNGFVDIDDAIFLFQHSMMPDVYVLSYPASTDFSHNGFVDIDDAILLFQHSMMPDVYPLS